MKIKSFNIFNVLILICILTRVIFWFFPFWGLEYEDAFIFNDTGRFLNFSYNDDFAPYKTQFCVDGSFIQCNSCGDSGGHFLTFPILLSIINGIFGYHYFNIFFLNSVVSIILILFIYQWSKKYNAGNPNNKINLFLLLSLFAITPFVSIFNTSGLVETFSSLFVTISFLLFIDALRKDFNIKTIQFWQLSFSIILAILTKRENLVLVVFLFASPLIEYWISKKILRNTYFLLVSIVLISALVLNQYIKFYEIEHNESFDIGDSTFTFSYLVDNIKNLFSAIFHFEYWGLTGILFVISIIAFVAYKQKSELSRYLIVLICLFIFLYSSHYRSYYQVRNGSVTPFESLRYAINYFPLIALFIASINLSALRFISRIVYKAPTFLWVLFVIVLSCNSVYTRILFNEDEFYSRIEPINETLKLASEKDIIITEIPSVFHAFVSDSQKVVYAYDLTQERLDEILELYPRSHVFFLKPKELDESRYRINFDFRRFRKNKCDLYRYEILQN